MRQKFASETKINKALQISFEYLKSQSRGYRTDRGADPHCFK